MFMQGDQDDAMHMHLEGVLANCWLNTTQVYTIHTYVMKMDTTAFMLSW